MSVVCNVGDDFEWRGLHVSPDIDTVIYTLAGLEGEQGWGRRGDTLAMLDELEALGEEPWFRIGDRDVATHLWRSERLRGGEPLSAVTAELARAARPALPAAARDRRPAPHGRRDTRGRAELPGTTSCAAVPRQP